MAVHVPLCFYTMAGICSPVLMLWLYSSNINNFPHGISTPAINSKWSQFLGAQSYTFHMVSGMCSYVCTAHGSLSCPPVFFSELSSVRKYSHPYLPCMWGHVPLCVWHTVVRHALLRLWPNAVNE